MAAYETLRTQADIKYLIFKQELDANERRRIAMNDSLRACVSFEPGERIRRVEIGQHAFIAHRHLRHLIRIDHQKNLSSTIALETLEFGEVLAPPQNRIAALTLINRQADAAPFFWIEGRDQLVERRHRHKRHVAEHHESSIDSRRETRNARGQ